MNDTPEEITRLIRSLFALKTGPERVRMASDMFESARRMALASLPGNVSPEEKREFQLQRTYPELFPNRAQGLRGPFNRHSTD